MALHCDVPQMKSSMRSKRARPGPKRSPGFGLGGPSGYLNIVMERGPFILIDAL